jgi:hypothetical protein
MRTNSGRIALVGTVLTLAFAGCGGSSSTTAPSTDKLTALCNKATYELTVIYHRTVGGSDPRQSKEAFTKFATQSLPVIESALGKVKSMNGPRAAKAKAELESSRRQVLLLEHAIVQTDGDDLRAFPGGTFERLYRAVIGCAPSREPIRRLNTS